MTADDRFLNLSRNPHSHARGCVHRGFTSCTQLPYLAEAIQPPTGPARYKEEHPSPRMTSCMAGPDLEPLGSTAHGASGGDLDTYPHPLISIANIYKKEYAPTEGGRISTYSPPSPYLSERYNCMGSRFSAKIRPPTAPAPHSRQVQNVEKPSASLKTIMPAAASGKAVTRASASPPPPICPPAHKILAPDAADCNFLLILAKHLGISLWIRLQQGNRIALQLKIKEQLNVPDSRNRKAS